MPHHDDMTYKRLGRCGTKVSLFSLGGWTTFGGTVKDPGMAKQMITLAYEAGVNFFDISDAYEKGEAERVMGAVFKELPRHELVISSKVFFPISEDVNDRGLSRKHIMESVDKSLRNVGTDYLDIYFCHRHDAETPLEETVRAMDDLVRQGKVIYWATSEWSGAQLVAAHRFCQREGLHAPQVEQPQYSLLARRKFEQDVGPVARALGMGTVIWSPLRMGMLTGKYDAGVPEDSRLKRIDWLREDIMREDHLERIRKFAGIAEQMGTSRTRLAIAWAAQHDAVSSVILGANHPAQLEDNLAAMQLTIPDEVNLALDELFPASVGI
jgi:voltage-dependent potassium channel beta subunit